MDISDDTLVRIPGQDQPVKYGELYKRLQGDYTKKTQTLAQQKAQYDKDVAAFNTRKQAEENTLKQTAAALLARGQGGQQGQQGGQDFLTQLASRPYLDGATAAQIVRSIQQEGFGSVVKAIQDRDTIIQNFHQRLGSMQQVLDQLSGAHTETAVGQRLQGWMQQADIPEEAIEFAKDMYSAYEGDDLDNEFPQILADRWNQLQQINAKRRQSQVDAARSGPFPLPGRGGNGTPSRALPTFKGNENAREMADTLWEQLHPSQT